MRSSVPARAVVVPCQSRAQIKVIDDDSYVVHPFKLASLGRFILLLSGCHGWREG